MLILILAAFLVLVPQIAHSDCVDYHGFHSSVVGSIDTPGYAYGVAVSGAFAYVGDNTSGLQVINMSDPASPSIVGSVDTPGSARSVAVSGSFAYVADGTYGLQVIDVSNPSSPSIVANLNTPAASVVVSGTHAYVAGSNLLVIDVSNPASPAILASLNTPGVPIGLAVSGAIVYVADGLSGLTLVDVTNPASPVIRGTVSLPHEADRVAVSGTMAYVACPNWGIYVIDASNPNFPSVRSSVETPSSAYGVAASGTVAYVADAPSGIQVIDASNPVSPVISGSMDVTDARSLVVAGTFAYVAGGANGFQVLDASNPSPPAFLAALGVPAQTRGVALSGTLAYVTTTFGAVGSPNLYVFDVSNPASLGIAGTSVIPDGLSGGITISGTFAYVTGGGGPRGLQVINLSNLAIVGTVDTPGDASDVAVSGNFAYVADGTWGLQVIDVSNPMSPVIVGNVDPDGGLGLGVRSVVVTGTLACVANRYWGLQVIDVSNPASPTLVGTDPSPGGAYDVALSGTLAYVAKTTGIELVDVWNPTSPVFIASVPSSQIEAFSVAVSGRTLYATMGNGTSIGTLQVIDVSNPYVPEILGTSRTPCTNLTVSDSVAYLVGVGFVTAPTQCPNAAPSIQDPGNHNGIELKYFSLTVIATDPEGDPLTMSLVGPAPAWATFSDLGSGTALLRGTPQSGQAGTYPISIRSSDGLGADTTSFNIVVAPALTTVNLGSSGFVPGNATILAGAQVKWVKIAGGNHTTTNGTGPLDPAAGTLWDAQLRATSPQFIRVFPTSGTFPYFCRNHPSETGTITVGSAQVGIDETVSPRFRLAASPNPFRSGIYLEFELDRAGHASVIILDLQGRKVRELVTAEFPAGTHRVTWEGRDDRHLPVGPGLYFARLATGDGQVQVQKLFKIR